MEHMAAGGDHARARVARDIHRIHAYDALHAALPGLDVGDGRRGARDAAAGEGCCRAGTALRRQGAVVVVLGRQETRRDEAAGAEPRLRQESCGLRERAGW